MVYDPNKKLDSTKNLNKPTINDFSKITKLVIEDSDSDNEKKDKRNETKK